MARAQAFAVWPRPGSPVSVASFARELSALARVSLAPPPFPEDAAKGAGQPVIVLPGFLRSGIFHGAASPVPEAARIRRRLMELRHQLRPDPHRACDVRSPPVRDLRETRIEGFARGPQSRWDIRARGRQAAPRSRGAHCHSRQSDPDSRALSARAARSVRGVGLGAARPFPP